MGGGPPPAPWSELWFRGLVAELLAGDIEAVGRIEHAHCALEDAWKAVAGCLFGDAIREATMTSATRPSQSAA